MQNSKQNNRAMFSRFAVISLVLSFLTTAASSSFAQTASRVFYNQQVLATQYSLESDPLDSKKFEIWIPKSVILKMVPISYSMN
jgi:hypothetical protein